MSVFKHWKTLLRSSNFSFNGEVIGGFLLGTLFDSDAVFTDADNRICVDITYLKRTISPKIVVEALDFLVEHKFIVFEDDVYVIGEESGLMDVYPYFLNKYRDDMPELGNKKMGPKYLEYAIVELYEDYKIFCDDSRRGGQAQKIRSCLQNIINTPQNKVRPIDVVSVLRYLGAMKFFYKEVSFTKPLVKELGSAKTVLTKSGSSYEALDCAAYFVINFDSFKDRIVKSPDVFKFNMKYTDIKHKMATLDIQENEPNRDYF